MTLELDHPARRCTIRLTGTILRSDLLNGIRQQIAAGAWTWETLIDTTAAAGIATAHQDTEAVLAEIEVASAGLPRRGNVVILVGEHQPAIYGMARMYQAMAGDTGMRIAIVRHAAEVGTSFLSFATQ